MFFTSNSREIDVAMKNPSRLEDSSSSIQSPIKHQRAEDVLQLIVAGTGPTVGTDFFESLVRHLGGTLRVRYAFVSELCGEHRQRVRTVAWWAGTGIGDNFEYALAGTPCEKVFEQNGARYASDVQRQFPHDQWLRDNGVESYLAVPIYDPAGNAVGHLGVLHDGPMTDDLPRESILQIFAARAGAELERQRTEQALRESEEHFRNLIEGSIEGILIHKDWKPLFVNQAWADILGYESPQKVLALDSISSFFAPHEQARLLKYREARIKGEAAPTEYEYEALRKDGSTIILRNLVRVVNWQGQRAIQNTVIDVTKRHESEMALSASEERFRKLFEHSNDAVIIHTVNGRILDVNSRTCEMLGYDCNVLMSMQIPALHPQAEQEAAAKALRLVEEQESVRYESRFKRADGTEIDVEISARIIDPEEQIVQGIARDITARKRADEALRRYQWMVSASTDLMAFVDRDYTYQAVNSAYAKTFGTTIEGIVGQRVAEIMGTEVFETRIKPHLDRCLTGKHVNYQHWLHIPGRGRRFLDVHYDPFVGDEGSVSGVVADIRDITEWKDGETELRQHQDKLRILASEMSLSEERERRRIAADLHDRTVQNLALSRIKTGALRKSLSSEEGSTILTEIQALIDQTIHDTRSLVFELSPPVLYELGFEPAVEWLTEQMEARNGVTCVVLSDKRPKPLDKDLEVVLFQAVRELLANVGKHAKATRVKVELRRKENTVHVSVEDNGIGFDVNLIGGWGNELGGFGLFSVRERLFLLGGRLEISSAPGSGTKITLVAPLGSAKGK